MRDTRVRGTHMTLEEWEETRATRIWFVRENGQQAIACMSIDELDQRVREEHTKRNKEHT